MKSFRQAQTRIGETTLREVIAELGWKRVNQGLEIRHLLGFSINGSLPLMLSPDEALLFDGCRSVEKVSDSFLIMACGGQSSDTPQRTDDDPVSRFRSYNLTHAAQLADMLDVAPLSSEKVRIILDRMDKLVEDFGFLFSSYTDECAILPDVYRELKQKVVGMLDTEKHNPMLSTDLTHLVLAFEDPSTVGKVKTVHGLKRFLHQKGSEGA